MATLGKNCYASWSLIPIDSRAIAADGSLVSEIMGYDIILNIVVEMIPEGDISAEHGKYVANGHWTGGGPTRRDYSGDDFTDYTWPWPHSGIVAQPSAERFAFKGMAKINSFGIGGLKMAFDCIWTFRAFAKNT